MLIDFNGEKFLVMESKYEKLPGRTEGEIAIMNNQDEIDVGMLVIKGIINEGEKLDDLTLAIQIHNQPAQRKKAQECGIDIPSELAENKDKWVGHMYLNKFRESMYVGIFYGNPLSEDKNLKSNYEELKNKLLDTDFLGKDPNARAKMVAALEECMKVVLGFKDIQKLGSGPEKYISEKTGKGIRG